ncbi:hypothetical protein ASPFODRAFT_222514 [Aspergillus luchuensis CBS 106.47]|uniref:Uncharacterized protein n=1 Tax=Aspergillus luchuensis (strain CBS 106.47) TaxID=1137211 RepID=A0A1M3T5K2_ASPLC|nr:hypothetical protein ASPFODRAFT_222514 [Aspergillus luchuensis CBS 106.47]
MPGHIDTLPCGHLDDPAERNDYQVELKACQSRIAHLVRQNDLLQGNIRLQAAEIRFLREQRDQFRDMQRDSDADPRLRGDPEQLQELIQLQAEQIQSLTAERDYYRHEQASTASVKILMEGMRHRNKTGGDAVEPASLPLHPSQERKREK